MFVLTRNDVTETQSVPHPRSNQLFWCLICQHTLTEFCIISGTTIVGFFRKRCLLYVHKSNRKKTCFQNQAESMFVSNLILFKVCVGQLSSSLFFTTKVDVYFEYFSVAFVCHFNLLCTIAHANTHTQTFLATLQIAH